MAVLVEDEHSLSFSPNFSKIKHELLRMADGIIRSVQTFERLDSFIYPNLGNERNLLKVRKYSISPTSFINKIDFILQPTISSDLVQDCHDRIRQMLADERKGPEERLHDFDEYRNLMNGVHAQRVMEFVNATHSFQEYCGLVEEYREIEKNITVNLWGVVRTGFYDFHRTGLINILEMIARFLQTELLQTMVNDQQNEMVLLQAEYNGMFNKALSMPEETASLLELEIHVRQIKVETIPQMGERLKVVSCSSRWK